MPADPSNAEVEAVGLAILSEMGNGDLHSMLPLVEKYARAALHTTRRAEDARVAAAVRDAEVRLAARHELWMVHPDGGKHHQVSDKHHSRDEAEGFLQTYLEAGWTDPQWLAVPSKDTLTTLLREAEERGLRRAAEVCERRGEAEWQMLTEANGRTFESYRTHSDRREAMRCRNVILSLIQQEAATDE